MYMILHTNRCSKEMQDATTYNWSFPFRHDLNKRIDGECLINSMLQLVSPGPSFELSTLLLLHKVRILITSSLEAVCHEPCLWSTHVIYRGSREDIINLPMVKLSHRLRFGHYVVYVLSLEQQEKDEAKEFAIYLNFFRAITNIGVLTYSTMSQSGCMMLTLGLGSNQSVQWKCKQKKQSQEIGI